MAGQATKLAVNQRPIGWLGIGVFRKYPAAGVDFGGGLDTVVTIKTDGINIGPGDGHYIPLGGFMAMGAAGGPPMWVFYGVWTRCARLVGCDCIGVN